MESISIKVGELAKKTGISIRTLHYYDEIDLLKPSQRTEIGHRLYVKEDVVRLQQIISFRQLGFSLEEIRDCLEDPNSNLSSTVKLHISHLQEQIELTRKLYNRLEAIADTLNREEDVSIQNLLETIEVMTMFEKYYTQEQLEELKQRRLQLGDEQIRQGEAAWKELIEQVQSEMKKGSDPASETMQQLAKRWMKLIQAFTGGNPEIEKSLNTMYQQEGVATASQGTLDRETFEYMGQAITVLNNRK